MSNSEVKREFSEFGGRMKVIAILTLISIVIGVFTWFSTSFGFGEEYLYKINEFISNQSLFLVLLKFTIEF